MRVFLDRRGVVFRVPATVFALINLGLGLPLPLLLLGLLMKVDGVSGNPLRGGHAWVSSEREAWISLGLGSVVCTLGVVYGSLLLSALWAAWGDRPRVRASVRLLAVVCSVTAVAYLAFITVDTTPLERIEVLLVGAALVAAYCTCNVVVWIAFKVR